MPWKRLAMKWKTPPTDPRLQMYQEPGPSAGLLGFIPTRLCCFAPLLCYNAAFFPPIAPASADTPGCNRSLL